MWQTDSGPHSGSPPIVGRSREQAALRQHLGAAAGGRGGVVLVAGEAGIGKTSLVRWLADDASRGGARVLTGRCFDLAVPPPYGPWVDAFAALDEADHQPAVPNPFRLAEDPDAITSQSLLFDRVRASLAELSAASGRPVVLVLEDLHWADPASLDLLRYLGRSTSSLGLLVLATYRADELSPGHALARMLPALVREVHAERIDLAPLTDEAVRAFVAQRYPLADADATRLATHLQSRGAGNPFYMDELLRTLERERHLRPAGERWSIVSLDRVPVPPLIRQIIEGRLTNLDGATRTLLEVAAVIGQEVPLPLWQAATDADDDQLDRATQQAIAAHLMLDPFGAPSVAFTHALVRETVDAALTSSRRQRLHRRVAEVLIERREPPPSDVAAHFAAADDPRAIDWLVRAGERALTLYAAEDAVAALTRAHELSGRFSRDLPSIAYRTRAAAYALLGEFDRARRDHEFVLERARAAGDRGAEWQALLDLGMLWAEREYERTGGYYRTALDLARAIGEPATIAASLNHVANWHANLDEPDVALPLHREALALFEAVGNREGIAETLDLLGTASYVNCDLAASTAYCERAIGLLRELGDRRRLSTCLAMIPSNGGDFITIAAPVYREASYWRGSLDESLTIARDLNWPAGEAFARFALSIEANARGRFSHALHEAEAALTIAHRIDHRQWTVAARLALGMTWLELLDVGRAAAALEPALTAARLSGSRFWTNALTAILALQHVAAGEVAPAAALLGTVARANRPDRSLGERLCRYAQAALALARREPEHALAIADELADQGPHPSPNHGVPQLLRLRADALAALGLADDADAAYRVAHDSAALFGFRPLLWRIDAAHGDLLLAKGRPKEADEAFRCARATIDDLAATIDDEAIREPFRARASARILTTAADDRHLVVTARLSPREVDVLRLLVDGLSDREIAAALSISPRTVMRHVTGILTKLDVPSRTAAATLALRRRLV